MLRPPRALVGQRIKRASPRSAPPHRGAHHAARRRKHSQPPPLRRAPQWDGGPVHHPRGTPRGVRGGPPAVPPHAVTPARPPGVSGSVHVGIFRLGHSARGVTANIGRSSGRQCLPRVEGNPRHPVLRGPSRRRVSPGLPAPMQISLRVSISFCQAPHWPRNSLVQPLRFATSCGSGPRRQTRGRS